MTSHLRRPSVRVLAIAAATVLVAALAVVLPARTAWARPGFLMPFTCNETWTGNNWSGHSPGHSIDWNYYPNEAEVGKPILASAAGTVSESYYATNTGYGHNIVIDHGGGWKTRYAHLDSRAVAVGAKVSAGQRIGIIGNSSAIYDLAPHLHYEQIYDGGVVVSVVQGVEWYDYRKGEQKSTNCGGSEHPTGTVKTSGAALNVRSGPHTSDSVVGTVANGSTVTIYCQTEGDSVTGTYGTSKIWDRIGTGKYVSDAYVYTGSDGQVAPNC